MALTTTISACHTPVNSEEHPVSITVLYPSLFVKWNKSQHNTDCRHFLTLPDACNKMLCLNCLVTQTMHWTHWPLIDIYFLQIVYISSLPLPSYILGSCLTHELHLYKHCRHWLTDMTTTFTTVSQDSLPTPLQHPNTCFLRLQVKPCLIMIVFAASQSVNWLFLKVNVYIYQTVFMSFLF